jgi:hypothetical protein
MDFQQARSSGCWTLPATASMFTGLTPHEHGADSQTREVAAVPTLAERLQELGYSTHMVTANVATTEIFGLDRGFHTLDRIWHHVPSHHKYIQWLGALLTRRRLRKKLFSGDFLRGHLSEDLGATKVWFQSTCDAVFDRARTILNENERRGQPGFYFLNVMETHFPYHISQNFHTSAGNVIGNVQELISLYHFGNQTWLTTARQPISPSMLALIRRRQRIAWQRIAPRLDAFCRELRERYGAMVVFCSDHGDNFGEQGWVYHFSNVTDGGNRVPLFILPHDRDDPRTITLPVSARDLFGTIRLAAGDPDRSVRALDRAPERSLPIMESFWYNNNGKTLPRYRFNQFAFVAGSQRFAHRGDRWYTAPITTGDEPEPAFRPFDARDNPLAEPIDTRERLAELRSQFESFQAFSLRVLPRQHTY